VITTLPTLRHRDNVALGRIDNHLDQAGQLRQCLGLPLFIVVSVIDARDAFNFMAENTLCNVWPHTASAH